MDSSLEDLDGYLGGSEAMEWTGTWTMIRGCDGLEDTWYMIHGCWGVSSGGA